MSDAPLPPQQVVFDRTLIDKYDKAGPRYTSYPTAPHFNESFGPAQFRDYAAKSNAEDPKRPLSLYIHIPFCDTVCYYCACNKVVTPDRSKAVTYLDYLYKEIEMVGALFDRDRPVVQFHLGGGTPTYLNPEQLTGLMAKIKEHFTLVEDGTGEYGVEIDPREVLPGTLEALAEVGFNRISVGVQDLDPTVQKAVNRIQSMELTKKCVDSARALGFISVNVDLMYGLPLQTEAGFAATVDAVVKELDPDRFAVFNYAHLPQYFMPQRRVNEAQLPTAETKLKVLEATMKQLHGHGYVFIGMDHFAKPDDEMAIHQREGRLHRNFQGYTTHAECDLVGLGSTSISEVGASYAQNVKTLEEYYQRIEAGELAVFRGLALSDDDVIRRDVIMRLMCDFMLDPAASGARIGVDFNDYFAEELADIRTMLGEGLIDADGDRFVVTPGGKLMIRNIAMVFDWYLRNAEQKKTFSKTL